MAAVNQSGRLVTLLKRGWDEIPEVLGSSVLALIGLGMGSYGVYLFEKNEIKDKRHKRFYTVYRNDDVQAQKILKNWGPDR